MPSQDASPPSLEEQAIFFTALSDPSRLLIVKILMENEEMTMTQIQEAAGFIQTKTSRHLALLRKYNLVKTRKQVNFVYYRLLPEVKAKAKRCIE